MKSILLISLFTLSLIASDDEGGNEFYVYGLSYHTNRDYDFHEINPGIGIGHYFKKNEIVEGTVQASVYMNSFGHISALATCGPRAILGNREKYNVALSLNFGYMASVDYLNMVIIPCIGFGYDRYIVNVVFIPGFREDPETKQQSYVAAFAMNFGYKF